MHLKSLTLKGFKSFASSTTLVLEPGICAVVGPNGSGKSNVVDALAWVMGEQGAKTLRGAAMNDVIFAGAGDRKALGRAEVTLTIDNQDGALPIDYNEVSITRRVYRDGGSEYEINGSSARLMDIQELLSDSGIGREMHVIVGQGRLSSILESKPEDRRAYIEEAAGVLKHRRRKDKAERKLVSMQGNVDRLTDLTTELSKQLKPLARQAEAASRAATVQAELREAKLSLAADALQRARDNATRTTARAEETGEAVAHLDEQVEVLTEQVEGLDSDLSRWEPAADRAQKQWFALSSLSERIGATGRIAKDRASQSVQWDYQGPDPEQLEAAAESAAEDELERTDAAEAAAEVVEELREQVTEQEERAAAAEQKHLAAVRAVADQREGNARLEAARDHATSRRETAMTDREKSQEQLDATKRELDSAQQALDQAQNDLHQHLSGDEDLDESVARADREVAAADKRLTELRHAERDLERQLSDLSARIETLQQTMRPASAAQWMLDQHDSFSSLSSKLTITGGWETAVTAALGAAVDAVISGQSGANKSDDAAAKNAEGAVEAQWAEQLQNAQQGRAWILQPAAGDSWRLDVDLPAGVQWLLDHVSIESGYTAAISGLLVDVVLVDSIARGRAVVNDDPRLRAVTAEGVVLGQGWIAAGRAGRSSALETNADIAEHENTRSRVDTELKDLAGRLAGALDEANERRERAATVKAAHREYETMTRTLKERVERCQSALERAEKAQRSAIEAQQTAQARIDSAEVDLKEIDSRLTGAVEPTTEPSTVERDQAHRALAELRSRESEARVALRLAQERLSQVHGKAAGLRRQAEKERANRERHNRAVATRKAATERAAHIAQWCQRLSDKLDSALQEATKRRDTAAANVRTLRTNRQQIASQLSAVTSQRNRAATIAKEAEIAQSTAVVKRDEEERGIREQLGMSPDDLLGQIDLSDFDRTEAKAQLASAEKALRSLGKVNPLALEEYAALEERYNFLATQLDDVERARQDLHNVIKDVDQTILQLFADAWKDVEAEFPAVFNTLFPGGEGRLVLTDPEDMLTTGIEVHARPPGKRITRLSLLSGGEKSLTALALLVAIFRARPSPFYVMDEVEAALDDVNLRRLLALFEELRHDSQLIVITHQKPTMDIANVLYGVTMRGDGITRVISQRMNPAGSAPDSPPTPD